MINYPIDKKTYPRESYDLVPVSLFLDGLPIGPTDVTSLEITTTAATGERPASWHPIDTRGGAIGVMVGPTSNHDLSTAASASFPIARRVWVRITTPDETPWLDCGTYLTT